MVCVVSSIPTGGNFFAETLTPCCQFCTEIPETPDLCYSGKTRLSSVVVIGWNLVVVIGWNLIRTEC